MYPALPYMHMGVATKGGGSVPRSENQGKIHYRKFCHIFTLLFRVFMKLLFGNFAK